ncbi:kelch-like protein diablo isoform X2 [Betta splendens]|uniref:Kelch-like protein diablo isoform X2 n=1 Tax=Betta splendens TaxID=158456 RepID=A0A9W2Y1L6_BETSP|nr:kelch-like protein diablo isoform X2 [Betta splendens]
MNKGRPWTSQNLDVRRSQRVEEGPCVVHSSLSAGVPLKALSVRRCLWVGRCFEVDVKSIGGWTPDDPSCSVEQFCPEYNEWRKAADMIIRRGQVAVGTLGGRIYTAGGEDDVRWYSSVERYDPDADSWSADVAPLSSPRSGVCMLAMDGALFAVGGHLSSTATNTVERYDPETNTWNKQAPLLTRRTRAAAAVLGGHLYVMGGSDGHVALSSVERYDPADGTWSMCAHMLSPRENAGCAVHRGHIYVAGGRDELNLELATAERLHPETMRWTPVKCMRSKRDDLSLAVFNGALLAVGGYDGVTSLKTAEIYDHETNTWRHFGSMKSKHPGGRVAVLC